jgi:hypothetical protein
MARRRGPAGFRMLPLLVALAATTGAATAAEPAPVLAGLQPHRAVYDMSLGDVDDKATVRGVAGRIVTEFTGSACDGFTTTFRFVSRIDDEEGGSRLTDLRTTSFESADAATFQFVTQNYVDRKISEETKGVATREGDKLVVDLVKPAAKQATLTGKALFPTQHIAEVLEHAEAGDTVFETQLFDGGEKGEKALSTTAIIGKGLTGEDAPGADDAAVVAKIGGGPRWPVRLSYFDTAAAAGEQTPMYELSFLLYANGITRQLVLDYGDFTIVGKLTQLDLLERTPCKQ